MITNFNLWICWLMLVKDIYQLYLDFCVCSSRVSILPVTLFMSSCNLYTFHCQLNQRNIRALYFHYTSKIALHFHHTTLQVK